MKNLLGNAVRVVLGALVVYSCAGKSISRTDGDDPPPTADDDFTGGLPGAGGSVIGSGGTVGLGGTTTGKGGGGRGGTIGKGGSPGKGGSGGRGGTAGTSGLGGTGGLGGDDGGGGDGACVPSREVGVNEAPCNESKGCISMLRPTPVFIRRNQPATQFPPGDGGAGGEGGSGDFREDMASAWLCEIGGEIGHLAFDYYVPPDAPLTTIARLVSGPNVCGGALIGGFAFLDFEEPTPGTWTTQCLEVYRSDLHSAVSIDVPSYAMVRNLRFVSRCECPRQITRYTTCGPINSAAHCQ